jgi:hypothetical protein
MSDPIPSIMVAVTFVDLWSSSIPTEPAERRAVVTTANMLRDSTASKIGVPKIARRSRGFKAAYLSGPSFDDNRNFV